MADEGGTAELAQVVDLAEVRRATRIDERMRELISRGVPPHQARRVAEQDVALGLGEVPF